jgi:hypothetical protein
MDLHTAWLLWARGGDIAALICCLWAVCRGGPVEKIGAVTIGVAWFLSFLLQNKGPHGLGLYVGIIDVTTLIIFVVLAVQTRRLWTFFAAACMLNSVISHLVPHFTGFGVYGYVTAVGLWGGWALLACLVWGVVDYNRSQARLRSNQRSD